MIKPKKLPSDVNQRAQQIAKLLTGEVTKAPEPERSPVSIYLSQIGHAGGIKGGKARAQKLSKKKKSEIAKKAANARWSTAKKQE